MIGLLESQCGSVDLSTISAQQWLRVNLTHKHEPMALRHRLMFFTAHISCPVVGNRHMRQQSTNFSPSTEIGK
jgi:hypothetical protein